MAFFMGLYGFAIGLITGIVVALMSSMILVPAGGTTATIDLLNWGWMAVIVFPFAFGIINFLIAFILIPIINLVLKIIKGVDMNLVEGEENPIQANTKPQNIVKQKIQQPKKIVSNTPKIPKLPIK